MNCEVKDHPRRSPRRAWDPAGPRRRRRIERNGRGFSLIELLVVISIVALLIAILLPSLQSARDAAESVNCVSNSRQWVIALTTYSYDNDYLFVANYMVTNGLGSAYKEMRWTQRIAPYVQGVELLKCPSVEEYTLDNVPSTLYTVTTRFNDNPPSAYALAGVDIFSENNGGRANWTPPYNAVHPTDPPSDYDHDARLDDAEVPSETIWIQDYKVGMFQIGVAPSSSFTYNLLLNNAARHVGRVSMGYIDGHAASTDPAEVTIDAGSLPYAYSIQRDSD